VLDVQRRLSMVRLGRDPGHGAGLLHDFNRAQQYRLRECETERLRGPAVDDEVELHGFLDRQLSGLGPFKTLSM